MKLPSFLLVLLLSGCSTGANYIDSETETEPVSLKIVNGDTVESLRCLISMAHYITYDPAVLSPVGDLDIELHRGIASSTLYFKRSDTPLMAVENIFCGFDENWAATKYNLNLSALRSEGFRHLEVKCLRDDSLLSCHTSSTK